MGARILIRELRLDAATDSVAYSFEPGVNLILGGVGTGKTSLLQVMKFALGGSAILSRAVKDVVVATSIDVEIGQRRLRIHRVLDELSVDVTESSGETTAYSTAGRRSGVPISDLYLEYAGIAKIRLPRARSRPTDEITTISFWDVFEYLYLRQTDMDNSIVHHNDRVLDARRRATFELLYGLMNEELAKLEVEKGALRVEIALAARRTNSISEFLTASNVPAENELRLNIEGVVAACLAAKQAVEQLRLAGRQETPTADDDRRELVGRQEEYAALQRRRSSALRDLESLDSVAAQLDLEVDRLERAAVATQIRAPIEYRQCPQCLQPLANRPHLPGYCPVCLQADRPMPSVEDIHDETERVQSQLRETEDLQASSRVEIDQLDTGLASLKKLIDGLQGRIDDQSTQFVSRNFESIERASRELAESEARRKWLDQMLSYRVQLRAGLAELKSKQARLREVDAALAQASAKVAAARQKIVELSGLFDELIKGFDYPWLEGPGTSFIDSRTYLPTVAGETFEQASGGQKTLINVAYHLAALRYALQEQASLLPLFSIIDSPRKNIGSENPDDRAMGEKIYRRLAAMNGAQGDQFQMIVADNDPPPSPERFHTLTFTYAKPFVPWVRHPGPDSVTPIEI
jgi:hypothetical protein